MCSVRLMLPVHAQFDRGAVTVVAPNGHNLGTLNMSNTQSSLHIQPSATSSGFHTLTQRDGASSQVLLFQSNQLTN